jgi:hypothetical protein
MRSMRRGHSRFGPLLISLAAVLAVVPGCSDTREGPPTDPGSGPADPTSRQIPPELQSDLGPVVDGNTAFALDLYGTDHPFLFLIRDQVTGSVLFLGRVADPSQ